MQLSIIGCPAQCEKQASTWPLDRGAHIQLMPEAKLIARLAYSKQSSNPVWTGFITRVESSRFSRRPCHQLRDITSATGRVKPLAA
jgi:hypothetical protein